MANFIRQTLSARNTPEWVSMRASDFERMRETLAIAEAALTRVTPQIRGALCTQDIEYALKRLCDARGFFAD